MKYIFVALSIFLIVILVLGAILAVVEQATAAITGQEQSNNGQRIVVFVAQLFQTRCLEQPCNDDPITEPPDR